MSSNSHLAEAVQRSLSEWKPAGGGYQTFSQPFPDAGWNLTVTFDRAEGLGGSVWALTLDRTGAAPGSLTLKAWADRVANQVSGMLERLKVYEIDTANGIALLRSDGPQARGTVRSYYEVTLEGLSKATLLRFQGDTTPGTKREQVAFALTYESIGQVVEGMTA